jgi:hypothetical protein
MDEQPVQPTLYVIQDMLQAANGDMANAVYKVDVQHKLSSNVVVTYAPLKETESKRPGVIKLPAHFIEQLCTLPLEIQGCPIEVILKLAHNIKAKEGTSVLVEEKEIAVNAPKLIIPD